VSASVSALLAPAAGSQSSTNLVRNPGAEDSPGAACESNSGFSPPAGWQVTGRFTAVKNDCAPVTGGVAGSQLFTGGPHRGVSTGTQVVDLAAYAAAIDAGTMHATLSGLLGGWQDQEDHATVEATFLDQAGRSLGSLKIGPVTAEERGNKTVLLPRSNTRAVARGSRRARVVVTAVYVAGAVYNDGYADNVSLTLRAGPSSAMPAPRPLTASKEYRMFLGLDDPSTPSWSARTDERMEALERRAATFRGVSDESPIPGETATGKHSVSMLYPGNDLFRLLALDRTSSQLVKEGNVYARITRRSQEVLRAKILASEGNLQPADVMYYALQATHGSYPLAVLTAHNLLKDVTKIGRQAIEDARGLKPGRTREAVEEYNSRQEQELATLRRQVAVVQKLASLRANAARSGDKMGPWYHGFAVLTAGALVNPATAQAIVSAEHNAKWTKTVIQKLAKLLPASWLPKEGFFQGEGGYDPEKHALDKAFADAARSRALRSLSRHSF
jgi:hypothetical protein